jgi:hypothetical protein
MLATTTGEPDLIVSLPPGMTGMTAVGPAVAAGRATRWKLASELA